MRDGSGGPASLAGRSEPAGGVTRSGAPRPPLTGRRRAALVVGLVVALLGPTSLQLLPDLGDAVVADVVASNVSMWVLTGAIVALVLRWERRPLSSIGFGRPSRRLVLLSVVGGLVITVAGLAATGALVALSVVRESPEGLAVIGGLSWAHRIFLVVTAAVTEEVLYRGYPIERLAERTGRVWVGGAVAGVVFLAVHVPFWGPAALPLQTTATLGLVGLYVWQRSLPATMIAHATIDALLLLVLPALV